MSDEKTSQQITDLSVVREAKKMQEFHKILAKDDFSAIYGYAHSKFCSKLGAIKTLMVLDVLYRSKDLAERKRYVSLCDEAYNNSLCELIIFSSRSSPGDELRQLGGVAAILKYPVHEIDEINF